MAEQSGLLVVGIHKDGYSRDLFIYYNNIMTWLGTFYRSYFTVIEHEKIKQSVPYKCVVSDRLTLHNRKHFVRTVIIDSLDKRNDKRSIKRYAIPDN